MSWQRAFHVENQLECIVYLHQRWFYNNGLEIDVLLGFSLYDRIPVGQKFT